tara:strand:+ start:597 stop:842 length:246 start_codon:yes stop_codon:yes gene_type:complete
MADKEYKVTLNDIQQKAMNGQMVSIQDWLENVVNNKARKAIDYYCDLEGVSKKASDSTKNTTITNATIETAEDRNKRLGIS